MRRIGRYEILETLGRGGMGVVYRARDPELERDVAIKVILAFAQDDPEVLARFQREARVVAALQHPHIVTVYDAGRTEEGVPYFVMEFLPGTDLGRRLAREGPLPLDRAVDYVLQACDALAYAHARGVVHRDVKPGNLHVTPDDRVKVVDFGIAMLRDQRITRSGVSMGTPAYMAPEQLAGRDVDHRADLFALGAVLYALLSGHAPFEGPSLGTVVHRVEHEDPPPLSAHGVAVPAAVEAVLRRALAKDPDRRHPDAAALAEELRAAAADAVTASLARARAAAAAPTRPLTARGRSGVGAERRSVARAAGPARRSTGGRRRAALAVATVAGVAAAAILLGRAGREGGGNPEPGPVSGARAAQPGAETPGTEPAAAPREPSAGRPPATGDRQPLAAVEWSPLTPAERARLDETLALLARGIASKDSALVAAAFGGRVPPTEARLLQRVVREARPQMRYEVLDARRRDDGTVLAQLRLGFLGARTLRPNPRTEPWVAVLEPDGAGRLVLRRLRPRERSERF